MMSKCAHCNSFRWELSLEEPEGSAFKFYFVRCAGCKNPVGVTGFYDTHTELEKVEKSIITLGDSVSGMLRVIDENVRRLFHK